MNLLLKSISPWPLVAKWTHSETAVSVITSINDTVSKNVIAFEDIRAMLVAAANPAFEWVVASISAQGEFTVRHIRQGVEPSPAEYMRPGLFGGTQLLAAWLRGDDLIVQCCGASNSFPDFPSNSVMFMEQADSMAEHTNIMPVISGSVSGDTLSITVPKCKQPVYLTAFRGSNVVHFVTVVDGEDSRAQLTVIGEGQITVKHQAGVLRSIQI